MELGLGIHGEPGVKRMELQPADPLTETLLSEILKHGSFGDEKRVAVMVNNLGATSEMELAIVARCAARYLARKGFTVERIYAGTFLSSLDMAGISISVLGLNDDRLRWLDAPTTAPAWPNAAKERPGNPEVRIAAEVSKEVRSGGGAQTEAGRKTKQAIEAACKALMAAESELTEMDRVTGDGDLGVSMARAAKAVQGRSRVLSFGRSSRYAQSARSYAAACVGRILRTALRGFVSALRQCFRGQPRNWIGAMGRSAGSGVPRHQRIGWRQARRPHHAGCARSLRQDIAAGYRCQEEARCSARRGRSGGTRRRSHRPDGA